MPAVARAKSAPARCCRGSHPHRAASMTDAAWRRQLAAWLEGIGAADVAVLDGGTQAWAAAGLRAVLRRQRAVQGVRRVGGAPLRHRERRSAGAEAPGSTTAATWWCWTAAPMRSSAACRSRPAISVPGGELVYRIGDLVPDPETLVVVNCAGRTRSILGAESLRRAGMPEPGGGAAQRHDGLGTGRADAASAAAPSGSPPGRRRRAGAGAAAGAGPSPSAPASA